MIGRTLFYGILSVITTLHILPMHFFTCQSLLEVGSMYSTVKLHTFARFSPSNEQVLRRQNTFFAHDYTACKQATKKRSSFWQFCVFIAQSCCVRIVCAFFAAPSPSFVYAARITV